MNGELGTVRGLAIDTESGSEVLEIDSADSVIEVSRDKARHLDLAYAITVHKAQGSAFDVVIVPIVAYPLIDRTLVYTALTRARHKTVLVGDRQAFRHAVTEEPSSSRRRSALAWHLDQELRTTDEWKRNASLET